MASHYSIIKKAKSLHTVRSLDDLAALLRVPEAKMSLYSINPFYHVYNIRKDNGKFRLIEDPATPMKAVLRKFNDYLQAAYYTIRPNSVYGFCINNNLEEDRNIVSNARRHIGNKWMLKLDFIDFFHTVTSPMVNHVWQKHFSHFKDPLKKVLTNLVCYHGRLPMGAPTSPVLSNFATLPLDDELSGICKSLGVQYTRFADDCTFSSDNKIDNIMTDLFKSAIGNMGYVINEDKTKLFGPQDIKIVTGIVVGELGISLPSFYIPGLQTEIERMKQVRMTENRYRTGMSVKKLKLFEQELNGKINFVEMVLGDTQETKLLNDNMFEAMNFKDDFESNNWLDIPYVF